MFSLVEDAGIRNAPCAGAAALRCNEVVLVGDLEVFVGAESCGWNKTELLQVSPEPKRGSNCSAPGTGKPSMVMRIRGSSAALAVAMGQKSWLCFCLSSLLQRGLARAALLLSAPVLQKGRWQ